jgi:hypothetical protein
MSVYPQCAALLTSLRRMIELLPGLEAPAPTVADGVLERLRRDA